MYNQRSVVGVVNDRGIFDGTINYNIHRQDREFATERLQCIMA